MKQMGHYGVSLLLYAPVAFLVLSRGEEFLALLGGTLAISLAMVPDCDRVLPFVEHRGPTHSFVFALAVGGIVGSAGWTVAAQVDDPGALVLALYALGVSTLTVVSHLVADVLTPMGIRPFWPFSDRHLSFDLFLAKSWVANTVFFVLGAVAIVLVVLGTYGA